MRTDLGPQPVSYSMDAEDTCPGIMRLRHEADHSPTCSGDVKNEWSFISPPPQNGPA